MARFCCRIPAYLLLFYLIPSLCDTDHVFYTFKPVDVLSVVEDSCLVVGIAPVKTELAEVLQTLVGVFHSDAVTMGILEPDGFLWPSGEPLKWKDNIYPGKGVHGDIGVFRRRRRDRKCLFKGNLWWSPVGQLYSGPETLEPLVEFINSVCHTFRHVHGTLSSDGLHRQYILNNLFHTASVTDMTMGELYRTPRNPLNDTYVWHGVGPQSCEAKSLEKDEQKCESNISRYAQSTSITQCERIKYPVTKEEFFNRFVKQSMPVIFENAVNDWPAFSKWTNEFLVNKYGDRDVHVKLTPGGDFEGVEKAELWEDYANFTIPSEVKKQLLYPDLVVVRPAGVNLKFSEFVTMITEAAQQEKRNLSAYLEYSSIPEYLPGLQTDIQEPEFMSALLDRRHLNMWLSDGNTLGRLHFDPFDNLLCQISGKKQVLLFEPHHNEALYEAHIPQAMLGFNRDRANFRRKTLQDSTSMVMSPVDVLNPDFDRFPLFAGVRPLNCTLGEGDMLYLPAFWWHEVQSFPSVTENRNLAVNFWYEPFLTREFPCPECRLDVNPYYYHLL